MWSLSSFQEYLELCLWLTDNPWPKSYFKNSYTSILVIEDSYQWSVQLVAHTLPQHHAHHMYTVQLTYHTLEILNIMQIFTLMTVFTKDSHAVLLAFFTKSKVVKSKKYGATLNHLNLIANHVYRFCVFSLVIACVKNPKMCNLAQVSDLEIITTTIHVSFTQFEDFFNYLVWLGWNICGGD